MTQAKSLSRPTTAHSTTCQPIRRPSSRQEGPCKSLPPLERHAAWPGPAPHYRLPRPPGRPCRGTRDLRGPPPVVAPCCSCCCASSPKHALHVDGKRSAPAGRGRAGRSGRARQRAWQQLPATGTLPCKVQADWTPQDAPAAWISRDAPPPQHARSTHSAGAAAAAGRTRGAEAALLPRWWQATPPRMCVRMGCWSRETRRPGRAGPGHDHSSGELSRMHGR